MEPERPARSADEAGRRAGPPDGAWTAGFGRAEITLPKGAPLRGYYHERLASGVLDPLLVRALVWQGGGPRLVLVSCDVCHVTREIAERARARAAARAEVESARVLLAATHTHTGPELLPEMGEQLAERVEQAVAEALANEAPCRVSCGSSRARGLAFNRRYRMKDGTVATNPGGRREEIVEPAGPVDETLRVLCFDSPEGAPRGVLFHYGLHVDTVGGCQVSADWPGVVERDLRAAWRDPSLHAQFLLAPCGDVNHFDFIGGRVTKGSREAERIGRAVAASVRHAAGAARPLTPGRLEAAEATVDLPVYRPSEEERARAREILARPRDAAKDFTLDVVEAAKIERTASFAGRPLSVPLQALRAGSWSLVSVPVELFVELGRAIRPRDPNPSPWIATLANGAFGYLPSARAFAEGGYEALSSNFVAAAPGVLAGRAVKLLEHLR